LSISHTLVAALRRDHRRIAKRPGPDVQGRDVVGVPSEAARPTKELSLRDTVGLLDRAAFGTRLAGVVVINKDDRHTGQRGLVLDEGSELEEGPVGMLRPLAASHGYSLTGTIKPFERDGPESVLRLGDNTLGNDVVHVPLVASLTARNAPQLALCGPTPVALKVAPPVAVPATGPLDGLAGVEGPIGVREEPHDPKVTAQGVLSLHGYGLRGIDYLEQEEAAIPVDEFGFPLAGQCHTGAGREGHAMPVDEYRPVALVCMVADRDATALPEVRDLAATPLIRIGICDLAYGNGGLTAAQSEALSEFVVSPALKGKPTEGLLLEGDAGEPVARTVEVLHHGEERLGLSRPYQHYGREFHGALSIPDAGRMGEAT